MSKINLITSKPKRTVRLRPRPEINAKNQDLADITNRVWDAVKNENAPPQYFRYGGSLCRLEFDEEDQLRISVLTENRLRYELARIIYWYKTSEGGKKPAKPPPDVIRNVLATPNPSLPVITRITQVPVFAPDGSLHTEPGYDEAGRVYYSPAAGLEIPPIPSKPTRKNIKRALSLIFDDLLVDFPFVSPADRAHALALFLLPYARDLIFGPTPNHLVESPTPGSGKDLLVEVCLRPALGPDALGILGQAKDEEEWRRRITSCLKGAAPAILLGNVTEPLNSGVLAAALTARRWADRLLGKNEILTLPVRVIWTTTANNPIVSSEIARRSIRIRIDPKCDRPWERTDFKHTDLRRWVDEHRGELVWAGLVIVKAWVAAGKPLWRVKTLGSFEHWTAVMGGILDIAGVKGFLENLRDFYESTSTTEGIAWSAFVDRWWELYGSQEVLVADLIPLALDSAMELKGETEHAQKISLGMKLSGNRDTVAGDFRIILHGKRGGAAVWRLECLAGDESSESFTPLAEKKQK